MANGHSLVIDHNSARYLVRCAVAVKALADAASLKNASHRAQVQRILGEAIINANDSMHDSYGAMEQKDYPNPADFWAAMFAGSIMFERNDSPAIVNWFFRRHLG